MEITEYSKLTQKQLAMFVLRKTILFFNVIFMRNIYLSTGIAALILLSGCNKDEYEGRDITGAKLTVYGTVEDTHTRVSNESWETTDAIGITLQGDNAMDLPQTSNTHLLKLPPHLEHSLQQKSHMLSM